MGFGADAAEAAEDFHGKTSGKQNPRLSFFCIAPCQIKQAWMDLPDLVQKQRS